MRADANAESVGWRCLAIAKAHAQRIARRRVDAKRTAARRRDRNGRGKVRAQRVAGHRARERARRWMRDDALDRRRHRALVVKSHEHARERVVGADRRLAVWHECRGAFCIKRSETIAHRRLASDHALHRGKQLLLRVEDRFVGRRLRVGRVLEQLVQRLFELRSAALLRWRFVVLLLRAARRLLRCERIEFCEREAHALDPRLLPFLPVPIRGRDQRAIGQRFEAGIAAVPCVLVVEQANSVLAAVAVLDVVERADPRDEVAAPCAVAIEPRVAEHRDEAAILRVAQRVSIAGQRRVHRARLAPSGAFIASRHPCARLLAAVLAQQQRELRSIRRPHATGLAVVDVAASPQRARR